MIVGTAGHIDHGKTSLVHALTGVDTDRLPEERRRGITIELGFAPLDIPGLGIVGVVDVPGHEAFVRTMVAGATGIDVGLLVVAADEGVMPQTREHVAILRLLGVRELVVALTKCDLADDDWRLLVADDVESVLREAGLSAALVVETSVRDGRGLPELRRALGDALRRCTPRSPTDLFRLPIDRAFSARGTGTVVTGTAWSGTVRNGAELVLLPSGRTVRVRGLQAHGLAVERAVAGNRVAVALAGVEVGDAPRGAFLADPAEWLPTDHFHAEVWREPESQPFGPREWLRLHVGTAEVGARVIGGIANGPVRVRTDEPVTLRGGDRFILRRSQPLSTVGGGIVLDPSPRTRRSRPSFGASASCRERLRAFVQSAGRLGVSASSLSVRMGPTSHGLDLTTDTEFMTHAGRIYLKNDLEVVAQGVVNEVLAYHHVNPLDSGVSAAWLRARFPGSDHLVDLAVERLVVEHRLELSGGLIRQPGWCPVMSKAQEALGGWIVERLDRAGREPPTVGELALERGSETGLDAVVRYLEKQGELVSVEPGRMYRPAVVEEMIAVLRSAMREAKGPLSPAHLREVLGISRKFLVPFLEFCDRRRITERRGEGRVLL